MKSNLGGIDKWLRISVGLVVIALGLFGPIGWWGLLGLVPLATGMLGTCPVYSMLGVNTCPLDRRSA
jgi:hypothetical protein